MVKKQKDMAGQRTTESATAPIVQAAAESASTRQLEYIERLSLNEQFRLVEIAHETSDSEIRYAALKVLQKYLNPLMMFVPK